MAGSEGALCDSSTTNLERSSTNTPRDDVLGGLSLLLLGHISLNLLVLLAIDHRPCELGRPLSVVEKLLRLGVTEDKHLAVAAYETASPSGIDLLSAKATQFSSEKKNTVTSQVSRCCLPNIYLLILPLGRISNFLLTEKSAYQHALSLSLF